VGAEPLAGDEWFVARVRLGRADAFAELVRRYQLRVYRLAVRLVGDRELGAEVAQDVFVQAWRSLPGFRAQSSLDTWLYRITINRSLNARRRRRPTIALAEGDMSNPAHSVEAVAEGRAQVRALGEAVAALSAQQRTVFVLRDLEGYSYEQIGAMVGVSIPAVKSRLYRARIEVLRAMAGWT
jgi:RNA polymerase sigma-70 factor (ECF subfamily)